MFKNLRYVYITTPSRAEAEQIGRMLVEKELAACVNIIPGMESIYRWKGRIETSQECVLIAKTTRRNMARLTHAVKQAHSYEVPCVVALTVTEQEGNEEYLTWLLRESGTDPSMITPSNSDG